MRSCKVFPGFLSVLRLLVFPRELTLQAFQLLFGFAIVARVLYRVALGVGIVGFQPYINAYLLSRRLMHDGTLCLDSELHIVAIGSMDNAYPFDLFKRKGCNLLLRIADQPQASNTTPIGEGDVLPIRREPPSRCFVLHAPVLVLEPGITFLAWLVVFALVIEARNGKPGAIGTGLPSLGVETSSKE